jgi:hypothetical protein
LPIEGLNVVRVGVAESSTSLEGWEWGAVFGRGVAGDEAMTSSRDMLFARGELTGRNVAAIATVTLINDDGAYKCGGRRASKVGHRGEDVDVAQEEGRRRGILCTNYEYAWLWLWLPPGRKDLVARREWTGQGQP